MTATQIIHEIECLPPAEQEEVIRFTRRLPVRQTLSGPELSALADRMVNAPDPVTAKRLKQELVNGFFGDS